MKYFTTLKLSLLSLSLTAAATAADGQPAPPAILLELYTSQGCYSCPPADELLANRYSSSADLIPLEFHVHYWDDLVYGFAGSWQDPFSSIEYTERQQIYNLKLRDTRSVYTPQLIVQGRHETVGSRQNLIDEYIAEERARESSALALLFSPRNGGGWDVKVDGTLLGNEELVYAIYIKERETNVSAGENKDKLMRNTHIVRELERKPGRRHISIPAYDTAKEGCAAWVQKSSGGVVLAAGRCPEV